MGGGEETEEDIGTERQKLSEKVHRKMRKIGDRGTHRELKKKNIKENREKR